MSLLILAAPVGSLAFAFGSLLCNMSQDNKCRSLNSFSEAKLIQGMLLQMLNAPGPAVLAPLMAFKSMKCGDARDQASFPGRLPGRASWPAGKGLECQGKSLI